jgi:hypothetical protein
VQGNQLQWRGLHGGSREQVLKFIAHRLWRETGVNKLVPFPDKLEEGIWSIGQDVRLTLVPD